MLEKKDIKYYANMASYSFMKDPVYIHATGSKWMRRQLVYHMMYARIYASNMGGDLIIEDKEKRGLCIWRLASKKYKPKELLACRHYLGILLCAIPMTRSLKLFRHNDTSVFPENTLLIEPIFVDVNHQGKGIAKHMILESIPSLKKQGYHLGLETQNDTNVKIYQKIGFEVIKQEFLTDGHTNNYYMLLP